MGIWQRLKKAVTRVLNGGGGGSSSRRRVVNNRDSRKTVSSNTANTSARRAYINAYKAGKDDLVREPRRDSWEKTKSAFKADTSKTEQREEAKKDTKDYFKATARKLPKAKSTEELVKSGDYEYAKPKNRNTKSADERPTVRLSEKGLEKQYKSGTLAKAESLPRGFLAGETFRVSEPLLKGYKDDPLAVKQEELYQKNKSKVLEGAGELAGTLVSFGGATKVAGKAVSKGLETAGGKKLVERVAKSKLVAKPAEKAVKRAVKKGAIERLTKEAVEKTAKENASRLIRNVGTNALVNATGGALYDVNLASEKYDPLSREWFKEVGNNAKWNWGIGTGMAVAPEVVRAARPYVGEGAELAGRKLASEAGKVDLGDLAANGKARNALVERRKRLQGTSGYLRPDDIKPLKGAKVEAKAEPKVASKAANNARYAELEAERKRLMDEAFSKSERTDSATIQRINEINEEMSRIEMSNTDIESKAADIASNFNKSRKKVSKRILEQYPIVAEVYDADRTGELVFGRTTAGDLFVGNPRGDVDYFGKLSSENYAKAKQEFIDGNWNPFVSRAKRSVPSNSTPIDVPNKSVYNNVGRSVDNGAEIGNVGKPQAGGDTVPPVDTEISARGGADNGDMGRVADTSSNAGRRSGSRTLRVSKKNRAILTESGVTDTHLSDVSDNYAAFSNALNDAKAATAYGGWVDPQSIEDLAASKAKTYLSDDGFAGVAVKSDGDICGVFKNPASKYKDASYDLIYTARANGGTKMDCYGKALVNRYERVGYVPVAKIPFNAKYVEDARLLEDAPDVYVLMKNADDLNTVASKIKKSERAGGYHRSTQKQLDKLPSFDDYDEALKYRDELLAKQEAGEPLEPATSRKKEVKTKTSPPETKAEPKATPPETKAKSKTKSKTKKEPVSQETFDKDFDDFRNKIGNAKTDIYELENKLKLAKSDKERASIRGQINALKKDVDAAHKKAALRYHPDKGGSDAWMGSFNEAYDAFLNGGKEANAPAGKPPKPQRTVEDVKDIVNKKREKADSEERVKNAWTEFKRSVVNSFTKFEEENLKYVKSDHERWKSNNGAIDKARRYNALAVRSIDEGQLRADGTRYGGTVERIGANGKTYQIQNGKSLKQIYSDIDDEAAFDAFLLLRHAPDRIREGTPIFDRINLDREGGEVIKSLNDPEWVRDEADKLLKEHPEFAEKAEELYQYTQNELENRVRAGLLSQETASKWMHDYPFYVPTGRDGYFNAAHGKHKGVIGADSIKGAKGSDLDIRSIKEQLAEATSRNWRDITTNNLLERFFGDEIKGRVSTKDLKLLNETVGLSKSADGAKYYAKIFRDGDMYRVEIDKGFYDDLMDLYKNGRLGANGGIGTVADTVSDASSKFSGVFKKLVTTWNPLFMPANFSRDMGEALINTRQTKEFVECLIPAWSELQVDGEYARAFRDSGVSQANFVNLDEALKSESKAAKAVNKFIALQDMTESFPRLAEYMATLKKAGVDITKPLAGQRVSADLLDQAAANAADVTVNFGRSGSAGKNLNKGLLPFFNPSMQGWSKFTRNFREQKGTKQLLGTLGKATMLGAGANALNNFLLSDNPNYQQISARDKATNYIIPYPPFKDGHINNDTNLFIKIPTSRFAAVYGLATVNVKNENKMGWAEMFKVAKDQVVPVDPTEAHLFAPLVQAAANKTWYGAPIESDYLVENYSPSQRYDANTSPMGKALGKATSGLPEGLQISPKRADYLIDAETGVIGDFALPMSTALARGESPIKAGANVVKKRFAIDSTTQNNLYSKFEDKLKKVTRNNNNPKAGEAEQAELDRMNAYSAELKGINRAIKDLQDSNLKENQKSIYEMQKVRNQMLQDALDGKDVPPSSKTLDAVQKYVGTSYAIDNFGSSADKEAMKVYGLNKYGDISKAQMQKKIDADKGFYKGVQSISRLDESIERAGMSGKTTTLGKAVALASVGADDDLFDAYGAGLQGRTETASKMNRAKTYLNDGGSIKEYVKLEKARKTLGKLPDYDENKEHEANDKRLAKGEISINDWKEAEKAIDYNANISYVGLATSFAQSNAPSRGYALYDIKAKNAQKGVNLAAMGYSARDYRNMVKQADKDGNGYLKTAEIRDFVANSGAKDKATLYDALYHYNGKYNPFGTPTKYTREQAAAVGKANKVEQISNETGDLNLKDDGSSTSSGYGSGYGRRGGYRRRGGGGGSSTVKTSVPIKASDYKASKATYKNAAEGLKSRSSSKKKTKVKATPTVKVEPPKVKFKKYEV